MAFKESFPHLSYPLDRTLLIVGMPGSGKTSIGRRLARMYSMPFTDADAEIEKAGAGSVSDLFARYGEADFRRAEEQIMERLLIGKRCVLSSGGGAMLSEKTRENAKKYAVTVFLDAAVETIIRNTKGRSHRPLLNVGNPEETIRNLMEKRRPFYEQADISLRFADETVGQIVRSLVREINAYAKENNS